MASAAKRWTDSTRYGKAKMVNELATTDLTRSQARALTDKVISGALELADSLQQLYEGKAHLALGYTSWGKYFKKEFGKSPSRGYQLLRAAKVVDSLKKGLGPGTTNYIDQCTTVHSERVARELVTVPAEARDAVLAEAGDKPTASGVRDVIDRALGRKRKKKPMTAEDVKAATRALRSGKEVITPGMRKEAKSLFGKLVRILDKMKLSPKVESHLEAIRKVIDP